jgi:hypothetical protein
MIENTLYSQDDPSQDFSLSGGKRQVLRKDKGEIRSGGKSGGSGRDQFTIRQGPAIALEFHGGDFPGRAMWISS